jgi:hypothetical protein
VEIARINAERDVAVAKLAARADRAGLETAEVVAEIQADAEVESSAAEAEVVAAAIEGGAVPPPEPIVIDAPVINDDNQADDAPPPAEGSEPPEPKHKAASLGMW